MKKFKVLSVVLALALIVPIGFALAGCGNKVNVDAKAVYAMSASSSVRYLSEANKVKTLSSLKSGEIATKPISNEDSEGMKSCLVMFDDFMQNGGVNQNTIKNTSQDEKLKDYTFVMNITLPGTNDVFKMYYKEINTETNTEIEDEEEEIEVSSTLEGIMIYGNEEFIVTGERTFTKEGNEEEAEIEFTTRSKTNNLDYIVVSQSVENNEIEYEYKIYQNGEKIQDTEIEIENEDGKFELEFELLNNALGKNTRYKIAKTENDNEFVITYLDGKVTKTINVLKTTQETNTTYTFNYDNGFSETL